MQIAKSNLPIGWGRDSRSDTMATWGSLLLAPAAMETSASERSDPMMKTEGLTERFFPLPQPRSRPMEPGARERRKEVTKGQGLWRVWEKCGAMAA